VPSYGNPNEGLRPCIGVNEYAVLRRCRSEIIAAASGRRPLFLANPLLFRLTSKYFDLERHACAALSRKRMIMRLQRMPALYAERELPRHREHNPKRWRAS
jgi:hypothetical protein